MEEDKFFTCSLYVHFFELDKHVYTLYPRIVEA